MNPTASISSQDTTQSEPSKRSKPFGQLKDLKPRGDVRGGFGTQTSSSTSGSSHVSKIIGGG